MESPPPPPPFAAIPTGPPPPKPFRLPPLDTGLAAAAAAAGTGIPQQRPHVQVSPTVYHRPVMLMPPVVLMGGDGGGGAHSLPASPIVEMPPSPAPGHDMMFVEFPDDDENDDGDGGDHADDRRGRMYTTEDVANANIVNEVSNSIFILLPLLLYYYQGLYAHQPNKPANVYTLFGLPPLSLCHCVCVFVVSLSTTTSGRTTDAKCARWACAGTYLQMARLERRELCSVLFYLFYVAYLYLDCVVDVDEGFAQRFPVIVHLDKLRCVVLHVDGIQYVLIQVTNKLY